LITSATLDTRSEGELFGHLRATVKMVLAVGQADPRERLTLVMGVFELICRLSGSHALWC
jgi:hypothetical protein